jgi:hypothetical protein
VPTVDDALPAENVTNAHLSINVGIATHLEMPLRRPAVRVERSDARVLSPERRADRDHDRRRHGEDGGAGRGPGRPRRYSVG